MKIKHKKQKKQFYETALESMRLTEAAVDFVCNNIRPICCTDFTGYLIDFALLFPKIYKKRQYCIAISTDGQFQLFPLTAKKKLTNRKRNKFIQLLYLTNFISAIGNEPFLEFSTRINLPINFEKVQIIESRLLTRENI